MNPVPPHHLLSAYLDGELSAREREEVEHWLEQSPAARQELLELEQVGLLLRQLPKDALPQSFAPQVLDACLSDTGVFESITPPPATALPKTSPPENRPGQDPSYRPKKTWFRFTSALVAASALGLIALLSWPKPDGSNRENIAQNSPPAANEDAKDSGVCATAVDDNLEMQLAAGDANAVDALNDVRFQQPGPTQSAKKLGEETPLQSAAMTMAADASIGFGRGGENAKNPDLGNKNLKDLPIAELVEALDAQGQQVAVVRLVVADRQQGLKHLQQLLQKHEIAHESTKQTEQDRVAVGDLGLKAQSEMLAVYVETSEDQLASVMQDLQQEAAFQELTMAAPVESAEVDNYRKSANGNPNAEARRRIMRFGGMGGGAAGARGFQNPAPMRMEAPPKPGDDVAPPLPTDPDNASAKRRQPEPPAPKNPAKNGQSKPDDKPAVQTRPSVAGFGAADADPLRELEKATPGGDRSGNEAKRPTRDKATVPPPAEAKPAATSPERNRTLSPEELKTLQRQLVAPKTQDPEAAQRQQGQVEKADAPKPVLVLFVLVDQANKAEAAPLAPAANAPSSKD